uniref:Uncharacterized protein n=1 Tax=Monopterus albus TaxID=43700 RepID=A0A3Q3JPY0_MONAL
MNGIWGFFSNIPCTGHTVACIYPLTFHANLCLSILVCVYDGEKLSPSVWVSVRPEQPWLNSLTKL